MIQQSFGSTGRHAAAGGERDACAPGCISASQQERAHENHLHAQLRMKGVALGLGLSASGAISAAIPCLSLVGARAAWSGELGCRLPAAAGRGPWCCRRLSLGRSSSVSTAWPRLLLGWRRRVVSSPMEWRLSLVWERRVQEIQPTRPPWRGPTPLGFFQGGAREGGGGGMAPTMSAAFSRAREARPARCRLAWCCRRRSRQSPVHSGGADALGHEHLSGPPGRRGG